MIAVWVVINMPASADWINPPMEELYEQSQLVVVGEFVGRDTLRSAGSDDELVVGAIKVDSILKGDEEKAIVLMKLPAPRPGGLVSSADIVIEDGQRGLWYLNARDDGLFVLAGPWCFVDMQYADEHIQALSSMR
jgi:hypothetical protein